MSKISILGKSLKGVNVAAVSSIAPSLQDLIANTLVSGSQTLNNVAITGGEIDSVTLGLNGLVQVYASYLQTGSIGQGFPVTFYGSLSTDSASWNPSLGLWNIQGTLNVRGAITSDTNLVLSATNVNLNASTAINIPDQVPLMFGNSIALSSSAGSLTVQGNINLDGNLLVSGTQTTVSSDELYVKDPIIICGATAASSSDGMDRGISFEYGNGTAQQAGFFGWQRNTNKFIIVPIASITNNIVSGAIGDAQFGNLELDGALTVNNSVNHSVEYLNCITGSSCVIDWSKTVSFISVTQGTGSVASCTASPSPTGSFKTIILTKCDSSTVFQILFSSSQYAAICDPGSGNTTSDSTMVFSTPGQSVTLIYDAVNGYFVNTNGGAFLS